ncbi:MAG: DUF2157 domain-containing protein [Bacillota bacterium]|nr:DUF2157 domain-containing protein [Bacillota bacterium]
MKKELKVKDYRFLKNELNILKENGKIDEKVYNDILDEYQIKEGLNFIKIVLIIGAVLIGLGIITFIGSNWLYLSRPEKFLIIMAFYLTSAFFSFKTRISYPKTSRSLVYLTLLIYGSGIFLILQMFSFSLDYAYGFLYFALGALPAAVIFKDNLIYIADTILFIIFVFSSYNPGTYPFIILIIIPALYFINKKYMDLSWNVLFINFLTIISLILLFDNFDFKAIAILWIMFFTGLLFFYMPFKENIIFHRFTGLIMTGITGIYISIPDAWKDSSVTFFKDNSEIITVAFSVLFMLYLLYLTKKQNLAALVFICILIFRYYVDTLYNFLPKSMFFIIGGAILLFFGFYFERLRKDKGGIVNE